MSDDSARTRRPQRLSYPEGLDLPERIGIARQDSGGQDDELRTCWPETAEKLAALGYDAAVFVREPIDSSTQGAP